MLSADVPVIADDHINRPQRRDRRERLRTNAVPGSATAVTGVIAPPRSGRPTRVD